MTSFVLLVICLIAQILIAGGLEIYLLRRYLRQRPQGKDLDQSDKKTSVDRA